MIYNFDKVVGRRGTDSMKWDSMDDASVIPMWVADMDFKTADCITEAVTQRARHGIFGYTKVPESYYRSIIDWFSSRHGWNISRDEILYTSGVVPAISATIKALASPGDNVLVQTPVYNCFFSSIRNNGCNILTSPLKRIASGQDFTYVIDFDDFERKCSDPKTSIFLLCNPHNPAGRVWTNDELEKIGDICRKHSVIVVSDEIHCELTMPGYKFVPFASVSSDNADCCVTLNSPSKSFNIAGLQIANIISNNELWRQRIDKAININEICDVNPFGVTALQAAYTDAGHEWLEQLRLYINDNYLYLRDLFREKLPEYPLALLEGTYLAWIDTTCTSMSSESIEQSLLDNEKVWVNAGEMYGEDGYIRINLACPRSVLKDGLARVVKGLQRLKKGEG